MATRVSKLPPVIDNRDLALDLVNAALSGGVPVRAENGQKPLSMSDRARADATYIAQLYESVVARLDRFANRRAAAALAPKD